MREIMSVSAPQRGKKETEGLLWHFKSIMTESGLIHSQSFSPTKKGRL